MIRSLVGFILLTFLLAPACVLAGHDYTGCEWYPGHLIVNFTESVGMLQDVETGDATVSLGIASLDGLFARYKVVRMTRIVNDVILENLTFPPDFYRLMLLECPPEADLLAMIADFEADANVEYAEPNLLRKPCDRIPNDPLWANQWDKRQMNCPRAWDFTTGSRDFIVCAIDIGVHWIHADYPANLWVNPGEDMDEDSEPYTDTSYPGDNDDLNGVDDDGNGKVDDFIAWDFIRNIGGCAPGEDCDNSEDNNPSSIDNHGTHVLGIIGAVGNNGIGVTGVNWNVRIMMCRAGYITTQYEGRLPESATIPAMLWAVTHGAKVINMSYGGPGYSSSAANACLAAWNNGALLCGASGNEHSSGPHYPSAYAHVISVGSTTTGDRVSDFSNYGTTVDCYAPGSNITSTSINPSYEALDGTSMASPNAAGVFALLWSLFPNMTNQQIEDFVLDYCVDITALNPEYNPSHLGRGRIDAMRPLMSVFPYLVYEGVAVQNDTDGDGRLEAGESGGLIVTIANEAGWQMAYNAQMEVTSDDPNLTITNGLVPFGFLNAGQSVNNSSSPVQITVSGAVTDAYWATLNVTLSDGGDYPHTELVALRIGRPQTLLVDDDGTSDYYTYFVSGLTQGSATWYNHDVWSTTHNGEPAAGTLAEYDNVIWVCGSEATGTLTPENQTLLASFLNGGGNLLLAGQNIDEDISGSTFYSDYLHAQTDGDATPQRQLRGVDGDPISGGTSLLLIGGACAGNNTSPSKILPVGGGTAFFNYTQGGVGAVRFENGTYKTAYFAFAIEAGCGMNNTTHYSQILRNVMAWFGATPSSAEEPVGAAPVPSGFALHANYPNPFNPVTTLAFDLARAVPVQLRVFDIQGRQVAVLADGQMAAGSHTVTFDGTGLASGIYLAHLQAGDYSATQRMVLLK
ncbi:S8 family peptidase [bacterium]|nr:S8 family peptidase [bacterium]MBU1982808.1 S8 family peptidase [bacterium]